MPYAPTKPDLYLRPLRSLRLIFLLPNQPHIHRLHATTPSPDHDWIDLHVGEMTPMSGKDIRQADHRAHQRVNIARTLTAPALEHFVSAQLFEHPARFALIDRQQAD